jgi:hypothetical protein
VGEHTAEFHAILNKHGRKPGFATCDCGICHKSRIVERRITARQALHSSMGADFAEAVLRDQGWHWAVVAMMAVAEKRTPATDCIKELADAGFELS